MTKQKKVVKKKEMTEEERNIFEIGFEEGFAIAKRLYRPKGFYYVTESDNVLIKKEIK